MAKIYFSDFLDRLPEAVPSKKTVGSGQCGVKPSYATVVVEGPRKGAFVPTGKWARAVICESKVCMKDWSEVGRAIARLLSVRGMVSSTSFSIFKGLLFVDSFKKGLLASRGGLGFNEGKHYHIMRRWSLRENTVVLKNLGEYGLNYLAFFSIYGLKSTGIIC